MRIHVNGKPRDVASATLADLLRENNLATVHFLPKRYADLDPARPFVASITITPISSSQS